MSNLQETIREHSVVFAQRLIEALRGASIEELASVTHGGSSARRTIAPRSAQGPRDRLGRRSAQDIENALDAIVKLVAQHAEGLRAEVIREKLALDKRELPKPLAEGIAKGILKKKGQKRSTTYFVAAKSAKRG
jgi:hypothetical protein